MMKIFSSPPRNEKWETIQKREFRNDVIGVIILAPMMYILTVMMFCL